ncbi:hypothetical protein SESBI_24749 [Sesbania bispinosa]|nr:hypothetical protein SESBI_24749 [Sesbania bispinosa]
MCPTSFALRPRTVGSGHHGHYPSQPQSNGYRLHRPYCAAARCPSPHTPLQAAARDRVTTVAHCCKIVEPPRARVRAVLPAAPPRRYGFSDYWFREFGSDLPKSPPTTAFDFWDDDEFEGCPDKFDVVRASFMDFSDKVVREPFPDRGVRKPIN